MPTKPTKAPEEKPKKAPAPDVKNINNPKYVQDRIEKAAKRRPSWVK